MNEQVLTMTTSALSASGTTCMPASMQMADHDLCAVHEVLRAAEGDETDFDHEKCVRFSDEKTAARAAVSGSEDADATLLFLRGSLLAGLAALKISGAAITFDDFVELLAHG